MPVRQSKICKTPRELSGLSMVALQECCLLQAVEQGSAIQVGLGPTDTAGTVQGPRWDVLSTSSRGSLAARLGKEAAPAAALGVPAALAAVVQVLAAGAGSAVAGRGGHTGAR